MGGFGAVRCGLADCGPVGHGWVRRLRFGESGKVRERHGGEWSGGCGPVLSGWAWRGRAVGVRRGEIDCGPVGLGRVRRFRSGMNRCGKVGCGDYGGCGDRGGV